MPKTILILTRTEYHIQLMDPIQQSLVRKPQMQKNHSLRLCSQLALSPHPPGSAFAPVRLRPSALSPSRLAALRRPASGSLILMTSPTRQRQLRQGQAASPSPSQCQHPSISAKEAATGYYSHRSTALGCSYRVLMQHKMAVAAVTAAERCDYGFVIQLIVNYIAY